MMGCYRNLSIEAHRQSRRGWKMKPKMHETQHMLEHSTFINPMYVRLYADEDLQRHIKAIAKQCRPKTVPYMCLFRWVVDTFIEYDYE
eukprot:1719488-Pyramimonas_sp.AAC.1